MLRSRAVLRHLALTFLLVGPLATQQKQDSIAVVLPIPRDSALDATVASFSEVGLAVSDQGAGFVEADLGEISGIGHGIHHMTIRAAVFTKGGLTYVAMRGEARSLFASRCTMSSRAHLP